MAELADLLSGANARRVLARRDITAVFRILRDAGVSQASIALATGQRQSEVSEIIASRQMQSVALLERIADGFGVPRGWMGLAYSPGLAPKPAAPEDAATEKERKANLLRHGGNMLCGRPVFGSSSLLAAAQLRYGELRSGLTTASRVIGLAKDLRSVSVRDNLAPLQEATAARRDSTCQDLARNVAKLRSAA